ncbi:MAG TPA: sulfatase [Gemmataceae bacterium]|nr:sulfatase [Gemmataceae bacterium]
MTRFLSLVLMLAIAGPAAAKPNVLVIVGDDMGYADLGVHGSKDIPTPHLDALAKSGVRFTSGYVTGPYCSPTRAGLLTGRYQTRFGHEFNPGGGAQGLPVTETTMADRLKAAGYRTALIGKWHLGNAPDRHPLKRGFDEFFGFLGGAHDYFNPAGRLRGTEPSGDKTYLTDALAREAAAFIDRNKSGPFFLYLAFNAVHTPMQADDERLKKVAGLTGQRKTYAAMMSAMDDAVGTVMAKLKAEKLTENTLVVFFSDNGGPTMKGTTVNGSVNAPLRGSKRTTLEGGVRVPFFLSWPGHLPADKVDDRPVSQLDVLPTALAAAGVGVKPEWKLEGVDLGPFLSGGSGRSAPHDALFWRFGPQMAVRKGDWKLVKYDLAAEGGTGTSAAKLYNLKDDIGEATDLAAKHPDKVKELQAAWDMWNAANVPPLWGAKGKNKD